MPSASNYLNTMSTVDRGVPHNIPQAPFQSALKDPRQRSVLVYESIISSPTINSQLLKEA
jgi:hypothetical protein